MRVRLLKHGLPKSGICTTKILRDNEAAKQRHPTFIGHVIRLKYEKPKGSSHPRWLWYSSVRTFFEYPCSIIVCKKSLKRCCVCINVSGGIAKFCETQTHPLSLNLSLSHHKKKVMVAVNFLGEWFQREKSIRHVVKSTWHDQSFSYFINSFCENHLSFANTDTDLETDLSLVKFSAVENILWRLGQWYHTCTKQPLKSWGKICPQKVHLLLQFEICTSSCQSFPWGNFQCTSSLWKREFSSAFLKWWC